MRAGRSPPSSAHGRAAARPTCVPRCRGRRRLARRPAGFGPPRDPSGRWCRPCVGRSPAADADDPLHACPQVAVEAAVMVLAELQRHHDLDVLADHLFGAVAEAPLQTGWKTRMRPRASIMMTPSNAVAITARCRSSVVCARGRMSPSGCEAGSRRRRTMAPSPRAAASARRLRFSPDRTVRSSALAQASAPEFHRASSAASADPSGLRGGSPGLAPIGASAGDSRPGPFPCGPISRVGLCPSGSPLGSWRHPSGSACWSGGVIRPAGRPGRGWGRRRQGHGPAPWTLKARSPGS